MSRKNGNNGGVTGTTRNSRTDVVKEKERKQKPPRLSQEEKEKKHGLKNNLLNFKLNFKAKNEKQQKYYDEILNPQKQIVICSGDAGTGKSYVCLSACLELLKQDNQYKKLLIVVPTVEAGGEELALGFLPGNKQEKLAEFLEADYDTIKKIMDRSGNDGEYYLKNLIENGLVAGDGISHMRGKTLSNCVVVFSEAENFSKKNLFLLISRMENAKLIFNGDSKQMDRRDIAKAKEPLLEIR